MKKKRNKKITSFLSCLLVVSIICGLTYYYNKPVAEATSAHREMVPSDTVILLDEGVPLSGLSGTSICMVLFNAINTYRNSVGVSPLLWSKELAQAAEVRAEEATVCWSHTRPNGTDYYTVNPNVVYGENLARGYDTAEATLQAWKDSPTHNDNLLYPDYRYVALAECNGVISAEFCY